MTLNVTFAQTDDFDVSFAEANETISVDVGSFQYVYITGNLEDLTVTPTRETQTITPTGDVQGFDKVIVEPIPQNYGLVTYNGSTITIS